MKLKKCPDCLTYLPVDADVCTECKKKVGKIDKYGFAKRPFDWFSYIRALLMWTILGLYLWYAFLRDK